jgi:hypothetical protein
VAVAAAVVVVEVVVAVVAAAVELVHVRVVQGMDVEHMSVEHMNAPWPRQLRGHGARCGAAARPHTHLTHELLWQQHLAAARRRVAVARGAVDLQGSAAAAASGGGRGLRALAATLPCRATRRGPRMPHGRVGAPRGQSSRRGPWWCAASRAWACRCRHPSSSEAPAWVVRVTHGVWRGAGRQDSTRSVSVGAARGNSHQRGANKRRR